MLRMWYTACSSSSTIVTNGNLSDESAYKWQLQLASGPTAVVTGTAQSRHTSSARCETLQLLPVFSSALSTGHAAPFPACNSPLTLPQHQADV